MLTFAFHVPLCFASFSYMFMEVRFAFFRLSLMILSTSSSLSSLFRFHSAHGRFVLPSPSLVASRLFEN